MIITNLNSFSLKQLSTLCSMFIVLFLFFSCSKKEIQDIEETEESEETEVIIVPSYDTIFPSEYLPAYPGSWWKYDNGETIKIDSGYHLRNILTPDCAGSWDTLTVYLPRMNNTRMFQSSDSLISIYYNQIFGRSVPACYSYEHYFKNYYPVFRLHNNAGWDLSLRQAGYQNAGISYLAESYSINDTSYDSINYALEYVYGGGGVQNWTVKRVFAKHIGLIHYVERKYIWSNDTIANIKLLDYFIND